MPVWRSCNLVAGFGDDGVQPTAVFFSGDAAGPVLEQATDCILLGLDGDATYIAADISELDEAAAVSLVGAGEFFDLRLMGGQMAVPEAELMAYARGMAHWLPAASILRRLRRRHGEPRGWPLEGLRQHRRRQPRDLSAHRPGGDHAGHPR